MVHFQTDFGKLTIFGSSSFQNRNFASFSKFHHLVGAQVTTLQQATRSPRLEGCNHGRHLAISSCQTRAQMGVLNTSTPPVNDTVHSITRTPPVNECRRLSEWLDISQKVTRYSLISKPVQFYYISIHIVTCTTNNL